MRLVQKVVGWVLLFLVTGGLGAFRLSFRAAALTGLGVALAAAAAMEFLWIRPYLRRAQLILTLDEAAEQVRLQRETGLQRPSAPEAS
jgi:hypothetical protein